MTESYRLIYEAVVDRMGRDGLYIDVSRLRDITGLSLGTIYAAVRYFEANGVFDIRRFRGSLLFLRDLSSLNHFSLNGRTFYQASVRRDTVRYENEFDVYNGEPMMELSFGIEA